MTGLIESLAGENGLTIDGYRGRRMDGRCLAVTAVPNPVGFAFMLGHAAGQVGAEIDDNIWWDALGDDFVVYWPDLPAPNA